MDWLHTFPIYKGKSNCDDEEDDDSERTMGKYKVLIYQAQYFSSLCYIILKLG